MVAGLGGLGGVPAAITKIDTDLAGVRSEVGRRPDVTAMGNILKSHFGPDPRATLEGLTATAGEIKTEVGGIGSRFDVLRNDLTREIRKKRSEKRGFGGWLKTVGVATAGVVGAITMLNYFTEHHADFTPAIEELRKGVGNLGGIYNATAGWLGERLKTIFPPADDGKATAGGSGGGGAGSGSEATGNGTGGGGAGSGSEATGNGTGGGGAGSGGEATGNGAGGDVADEGGDMAGAANVPGSSPDY